MAFEGFAGDLFSKGMEAARDTRAPNLIGSGRSGRVELCLQGTSRYKSKRAMYVMIGTVLGELDMTSGMEVPLRDRKKNGGWAEGG